jgi:uncharacterized membrane protein
MAMAATKTTIETLAPSLRVVLVSLILIIVAIFAHVARIPYLTGYEFWIAVIGYLVLLAGVLIRRL